MPVNLNHKIAFQGNDEKKGSYVGSAAIGAVGGAAIGAVASLRKTGAVEVDHFSVGGLTKMLKSEKTTPDQARTINKVINSFKNTMKETVKSAKELVNKAKPNPDYVATIEARTEAAATITKVKAEAKEALTKILKAGTSPVKKYVLWGTGIGAAAMLAYHAVKGNKEDKTQESA